MATVSTRLDDELKHQAETVADLIGIPLSTAINVFLKRFVAENGFPFDVVAPSGGTLIDQKELDFAVKKAVTDKDNSGRPKHFCYIDPKTNKLITVKTDE